MNKFWIVTAVLLVMLGLTRCKFDARLTLRMRESAFMLHSLQFRGNNRKGRENEREWAVFCGHVCIEFLSSVSLSFFVSSSTRIHNVYLFTSTHPWAMHRVTRKTDGFACVFAQCGCTSARISSFLVSPGKWSLTFVAVFHTKNRASAREKILRRTS